MSQIMRARTGLPALAVVAILLGSCSDAAVVGATHPGRPTAASTTAIASGTTTTTTPALVVDRGSGPAATLTSSTYCPAAKSPQFYAPAVPGAGKTVALTFDDGPGPSTAAILGILESYGVRATFFNVGKQEAAWPQEVRAEARAGFLVGNHTWNHKDLVKLSRSNQVAELDRVIAEQEALTGTSPCEFRPPDGDYDATTLSLTRRRHMTVWMWSVDTEDWEAEGSPSAYWVNRIVSLAESEGASLWHPVVLLHNQEIPMPATVAALPVIIRYFKSHGYTFVDLLGDTGPPASCQPSGPTSRPAATIVEPGQRLRSGTVVESPSGQYRLFMQADGDLVLQVRGGPVLWSSGTSGSPGAFAMMRRDGQLVVDSAKGRAIWETGTIGHPGAALAVQSDAELVIYGPSGPLWWSGSTNSELRPREDLGPGWQLVSPGGTCRLVMKRNGDLVFYAANGRRLWSSGTLGSPGAFAAMQADGNLVVYSPVSHRVLWQTGTAGRVGAILLVERQAEPVLELPSGSVAWAPS